MSLYGLDESIQQLLQPDTFQDGFSAKDFIEKLSQNGSNSTDEDKKVLDPKPYIRTFEAVLNELRRLQVSAASEEQAAAQEVYETELANSNNMINLGDLISVSG